MPRCTHCHGRGYSLRDTREPQVLCAEFCTCAAGRLHRQEAELELYAMRRMHLRVREWTRYHLE